LYSRDAESLDDLREQNEALREKVEYWKGQTKRTERQTLRQADINRMARNLIKSYGSELSVSDISADLKALGEYIVNGGEGGNELVYSEVRRRAVSIARGIVQNASALVKPSRSRYTGKSRHICAARAFPSRIRETYRISTTSASATSAASPSQRTDCLWMWRTWSSRPYLEKATFPSDITHPTDQLLHIAELLDGMRPIYENPHSYYMAEAVDTARTTSSTSSSAKTSAQTPPTFADRQAAKLSEQKARGQARLENSENRKMSA
jgi:hypothetical protein